MRISDLMETEPGGRGSLLLHCVCSVMMVGWGGNNGSTLTAGILANKL